MTKNKKLKILFIGDIFGQPGIDILAQHLPALKNEHKIDITIAQCENVTERKGFIKRDYDQLKTIGVDICTLGNHVWAEEGIFEIIHNPDIIRPLNIDKSYAGQGTNIFYLDKGVSLRVTSLMGITFNKLMNPWKDEYADNFFDAMDIIKYSAEPADFHFVDFHAETTSEKAVLALYLDGDVDAVCGTHTHVQTNDARLLPKNTCFITDVGMTGPHNCAIGANYKEVYENMRFRAKSRYQVSPNSCQLNAVVIELNTINKHKNKIIPIKIDPK
ncbi:hypothetical protein MCAL160_0653 [Mycoplasmopsis californica HAZ160_1]|uniref:Metallophosphoesterase n=2 Tax=Mycoplasmopsis californica TaxID=2113 RepID=A0A059XVR7_9BACT|nr:TIGR00282 family metallophosphoesterase [Mycoplasmopsis californica]AIA29426.1 metallophosphoesterase [Mycoplasmopsis californica]BAP01125.1 hypothetical protein MCAL160_0653 [Mycoplasmopsis californica HAZ160_1]BBG40991.1 hypothetical protein MCAL106_0653 [Mycoplasmopsis californica]BBG41584.1 hypothetical protein MCAL106E_0653 [Mycoplasmopsis californica]BBG42178.1 hypothetical protein MCAL106L_0653 [Mycoplasmopsis californica]